MVNSIKRKKTAKKCKRHIPCAILTVLLIFFGLSGILSVRAFAYTKEEYSLIDEQTRGILDDFLEILPEEMEEFADPAESSDAVGIVFLLECISDTFNDRSSEIALFLMTLIGLSMLSSLASLKEGEIGRACRGAVLIVSASLILDKIFVLVEQIGESLAAINGFYASVIPIVTAVNAMGLSFNSASAQTVGMTLSLQIYSFLSGNFLYSFVGALTALAALSSVDGAGFGRIAQSVRKIFLWIVGILSALVGATFSLQSIISSYADSSVMRGAKYAISGMIPIVGGSISGALSVLASGFAYLKGAVGGGTIAVIISLAAAPLITLLLYRACFAIAIFFSDICSQDSGGGVLGAFSFALDSLIAVYSFTVVIYIIQLIVFMKGGVGVA